ncbi:MSMEG_6728 family protein [Goodfellowiella coeruleoviolacea]|uniref:Cytoplasmic protein n=1 Tax=Goodfellowiella coeruleoviolacea TaxID=334858 RepID=A0AAE3GHZ1_9PSEU|nr:MSMEG_6728 family protein [Goodfellowiella coeruleoviolacea]MCP2166483.1 hypothetical protein [Goodfellowiella coeruleoviolacea]
MQTFLPAPHFAESARLLDSRRLGKQRVEVAQILRAVVWPRYGWKHHPAVRMWRGFVPALVSYGVAVCDEWRARGHADAMRGQLLDYTGGVEPRWVDCLREGLLPPWLGSPALHTSHRSALLRKQPEHYRPLFGDLPDDLPYVWPRPVYPSWPLRRPVPGQALEPEQAARLAGVDSLTDREWAVVHDLHAGRDATLSVRGLAEDRRTTSPGHAVARQPVGTDPVSAAALARDSATGVDTVDGSAHDPAEADSEHTDIDLVVLVAGWSTPGLTAWRGGAPRLPAESTSLAEPVAARRIGQRAGTVSRSVARPPSPEDLAAMRAEADLPAEFRFFRSGQPLPRPVDRFGLVVLDRVATGRRPAVAAPVLTIT